MRTETKKKTRRQSTATHFGCGHLKSGENLLEYGTKQICRTCKKAAQLAYYAKKTGKAPKTAAEPDPVVAKIEAAMESSKPLVAAALKLGRETTATPGLIGAANPVAVANAARWQGQCCMLDSGTGKRCSLQGGHPMPHSASGRTFSAAAAINLAAMGGVRRELDEQAMRGAGE